MIMEEKCPYCGSTNAEDFDIEDREWVDSDNVVIWCTYTCECGRTYVGNTLLTVTSRLIGRDWDEIEGRLEAEEEVKKHI